MYLHCLNGACFEADNLWLDSWHSWLLYSKGEVFESGIYFHLRKHTFTVIIESDEQLEEQVQNRKKEDEHQSNKDSGFPDLILFEEVDGNI